MFHERSWLPKLLALNVAVFLILFIVRLISQFTNNHTLYYTLYSLLSMPADLSEFIRKPWTIVTYSFVHTGFFHLLFNMIGLYWFGKIVELFLMYRYTLRLYIIGAIAGGLAFLLAYNFLPALNKHSMLVGASASVMAFLLAATTISPRYPLYLFLLGRVELRFVALAFVVLDILFLGFSNTGGHIAHLGGALSGFLFVKWIRRRPRKPSVSFRIKKKKKPSRTPMDTEIDRILDKIRKEGLNSLTDEERKLLDEYSRRISGKNKR
ncbi:MAG: rhomboid family intramembrane serine protease [Chlorobi bacterium]|nr:rhomboid family intramembrane serine protease [Chlorobiota bacterium]